MNEQLKKRLKGFAWGMGSVLALAALSYAAESIPTLGLSEFLTMTLVVVCEQTTKFINTYGE